MAVSLLPTDPFAAWWRAHRSTYLASLAIGLLLLFGLILRIHAYNDDLGREADGGLGWGGVGRTFAVWLYRLINSGEPTTGMAPLGVISTLFESRRFHVMQDGPVLVVVTR
jgi:hypothetical protein